ncbi:MAG: hypothetical protein ACOYON_11730 [Fimbriimonas sp.]
MILAALAAISLAPVYEFNVTGAGLEVTAGGIPLVRGSWFQYYEPDWSRGYFSSTSGTKVEKLDENVIRLTFSNSFVAGVQQFVRDGNRLKVRYEFRWKGEKPAKVEATAGMLWAPAFDRGEVALDGIKGRDLGYRPMAAMKDREFGPAAKAFRWTSPVGSVLVESSVPMTGFDARQYDQDWAGPRDLFWMGWLGLDVRREEPTVVETTWTFTPNPVVAGKPAKVNLASMPKADVVRPNESLPVLVPKPKLEKLNWKKTVLLTGDYRFPAGRFRFFDEFQKALARRFESSKAPEGALGLAIDGGVSRLAMQPGGYRITIDGQKGSASVLGQDEPGLRMGLRRLASLAFVQRGQLVLPTGTIVDEPTNPWRGVHLFVGPQAIDFQTKLWDRVLLPLGFNKVVLQCERTDWKSVPGVATKITMKRDDLAKLCDLYRSWEVEPIPLVQSFGHMEWLFANGKNLDLAYNPSDPYTISPDKAGTTPLLNALWAEVVEVTKAKTVHFGLDEVHLEGGPQDPEVVTEMWEKMLPKLSAIAKRNRVVPMLWGDMALHRSEAPDAANAPTMAHAVRRRAVIPEGAIIADWHYRAEDKPEIFVRPLQTWKADDYFPVASSWYRPENIRAFNLAANIEKAGSLQTTWAGYESYIGSLLREYKQYSAMVLAADYAWSDRSETVGKLGYDPKEVFREMFFGVPSPVRSQPGVAFTVGDPVGEFQIGNISFTRFAPVGLRSDLDADGASDLTFNLGGNAKISTLLLLVDARARVDDGSPVAEISVGGVKQTLAYGTDLRSPTDPQTCVTSPRKDGLSLVRIELSGTPSRQVLITRLNPFAGLRIHAIAGITKPTP